jgi:hypothetical protein
LDFCRLIYWKQMTATYLKNFNFKIQDKQEVAFNTGSDYETAPFSVFCNC